MADTQELIDALRRIEHAPNQGDRGTMGKIADATYRAQAFLDGTSRDNPSAVGGLVGDIVGLPAIAATADNISRGLPVDAWEATQVGLAATPFAKPVVNGVKGLAGLAKVLRK